MNMDLLNSPGLAPFAFPIHFCLISTVVTYIASVITSNVSQVDRVWTFLPVVYTAYFALAPILAKGEAPWMAKETDLIRWISPTSYVPSSLESQLAHNSNGEISWSPRALLLLVLVTLWMFRLSYNTYRRGLFSLQDEDYRWAVLRKQLPPWLFQVVNLTFIAATQNVLLMGLGWPAYLAATSGNGKDGLYLTDYFLALWAVGILLVEFTSDNQQYLYQTYKHAFQEAASRLNKSSSDEKDVEAHKQALSAANAVAWPFASPSSFSTSLYTPSNNSSSPRHSNSISSVHLTPTSARRGFLTSGLWRYSRHPNFACEQSFWWIICAIPAFAILGPDSLKLQNVPFTSIQDFIQSLSLNNLTTTTDFTFESLLGPSYAFAPSIALTILFLSSTAYTEDISRSKYPVAYKAYQQRVQMFGAIPLLGLFAVGLGVAVMYLPRALFILALTLLRIYGAGIIADGGRLLLEGVSVSGWWKKFTLKGEERNKIEELIWG